MRLEKGNKKFNSIQTHHCHDNIKNLFLCLVQKSFNLIKNHFFDLIFADHFLLLLSGFWSLHSGVRTFCTMLPSQTSFEVSSDGWQVLELLAAHIAGIQIGAMHVALVFQKARFITRRVNTPWKVADKWAKGNVPVLKSVLLEASGWGEGLLTTPEDAFEHARGLSLMFHLMSLNFCSVSFYDFAAELALALVSIWFRDILLGKERFVTLHMLFELGARSESLLAPDLGAFDDTWLSSLVSLHVTLKIFWMVKTFATQLAANHKNWVHISPMHLHVTN
jgi:hypothetical protein